MSKSDYVVIGLLLAGGYLVYRSVKDTSFNLFGSNDSEELTALKDEYDQIKQEQKIASLQEKIAYTKQKAQVESTIAPEGTRYSKTGDIVKTTTGSNFGDQVLKYTAPAVYTATGTGKTVVSKENILNLKSSQGDRSVVVTGRGETLTTASQVSAVSKAEAKDKIQRKIATIKSTVKLKTLETKAKVNTLKTRLKTLFS